MPKQLQILYIEDNSGDAALIRQNLAHHFQLDKVATWAEVLAWLEQGSYYDLIVTDLPPFAGNGSSLLMHLSQYPLSPAVVIITSPDHEAAARQLLIAGATDYIIKHPGYLYQLPPLLKNIFRHRQLTREQTALQESEARFRRLAENAPDILYRYRLLPTPGFEYVNSAVTVITGYTPEEHYADPALGFKLVHPDDHSLLQGMAENETPPAELLTLRWVCKDGRIIWCEQRNVRIYDETSQLIAIEGIARDVTERKQAEEALRDTVQKLKIAYDQTIIYARELNVKINELKQAEDILRQNANDLAVLYEASQVFLSQSSIETTLELACRLIVERFKVQMSWVGLITRDNFDITPMASYSFDQQSYVHSLYTTWDKNASGQNPVGQAIHTAQAVATNRLEADTVWSSWQQAALADGYRSTAALPLLHHQEVLGVMNIYSIEPDHFTPERLQLLQSFANLTAVALTKARLFEQVHAAHERLQLLSQQVVNAQEAERRHIARELHDEIGQTLTAVKINLQAVQRLSNASELVLPLQESMAIVEQAIQQVRNLSLDLRPSLLDDLGLVATLRWYLDRQAKWAGFTTQLTVHPAEIQLPANLETVCFRVVQEALTNVLRHAQAHQVRVDLQQSEKSLQLLIHDDGLGFEVEATLKRVIDGTGLGLVGMQERVSLVGGQFEIDSAPGQGTEIRVWLPLPLSPVSGVDGGEN